MQLFLDLDGVLADLDKYYETCFGVRPNQDTYEPADMWRNINRHGLFFRQLPPMPDAFELWRGVQHLNPIILSGIHTGIPNMADQKKAWVHEHLGHRVKLITCKSQDKCKHGNPGDILVDDRIKYARFWLDMGGVFMHHTSADDTLFQLEQHLSNPLRYRIPSRRRGLI